MEKTEKDVDEIYNYQIDPPYVKKKLIDLEDRSKRDNLCMDGIEETPGETWEQCEEKIQNVFNKNLGLANIKIERVYQSKGFKQNKKTPRTIICKLNS